MPFFNFWNKMVPVYLLSFFLDDSVDMDFSVPVMIRYFKYSIFSFVQVNIISLFQVLIPVLLRGELLKKKGILSHTASEGRYGLCFSDVSANQTCR